MSDVILPIPDVPDGLREASQRGVLIPFIGAGLSRLAGCPTWAELADGALRECIAANKFTYGQLAQIRHLSPRVKLSIARGLEAQHGFPIDYGTLINPRGGYEKNEIGNRVYRSLGRLGSTFVTTPTTIPGWMSKFRKCKRRLLLPRRSRIRLPQPLRGGTQFTKSPSSRQQI
jgi:hypothetical protein